MARRGPKPTPINMRVIDGGRSGAKQDAAKEPEFKIPEVMPDPPKYLRRYAKEEWFRVMPDLFATGVYTRVDESALAAYCQTYHRWRVAEEKLADAKMTIETTNGNQIQNPLAGVASKARKDMVTFAAEFGLTPSSRTFLRQGAPQKSGDKISDKYGF